MEFQDFILYFASQIKDIDAKTQIINFRRKKGAEGEKIPFAQGLFTLKEEQIVKELDVRMTKSGLFDKTETEKKYNGTREQCDLVFTSKAWDPGEYKFEWAVELKKISFVGDNGKNNDYGTGKLLSPYREDRSLFRDVYKISRDKNIASKKAIILVGWDHSLESMYRSRTHFMTEDPDKLKVVDKVIKRKKRELVYDPKTSQPITTKSGKPRTRYLTNEEGERVNEVITIFEDRSENLNECLNLESGPRSIAPLVQMTSLLLPHVSDFFPGCPKIRTEPIDDIVQINGLNRHPCGSDFRIFGWQIFID